MTRRLLFLLALLAALPLSARVATAAGRPAGLVPAPSAAVELEVGKGRLIRLERPATSVFIADPDVADVEVKSPMLVYVFGKAGGTTTLYAVGEHDEVLLNSELHVHYDLARVQQAIHELTPRSAVNVTSVGDSIVLTGTVYSASEGDDIKHIATRFVAEKQLLNKLKIDAPNQVNLRVRVAEVSRDVIKQFGIDWQNAFNNGTIIFGLATATGGQALIGSAASGIVAPLTNPNMPYGVAGGGAVAFGANQPSLLGGATTNNLFAGVKAGSANINSLLTALDNHGLITVLAEPNLTAISGEPAKFLAGGEFPVPVPAGNGTVGIEWKSFGVGLTFVATIAANDRLNLHVSPEVSQLSTAGAIQLDGTQVPALTTRRAETTIELGSGQSFAIAGLLQNNISQQINKFPWLGDVPVLGQLFRSEAFQRDETELVIIVTPYIVHPIATASNALLPSDAFVPSSDAQFLAHASEYQEQHPKAATALGRNGASLVGPVGFSLE
jgi:pilus assembly protein CpaC